MNPRLTALIAASLLGAGGILTWVGHPDREVSYTAAGELWADVLRDADQFGLQLTRVSEADEMDLGRKIAQQFLQGSTAGQAWESYVSAVGKSLVSHATRKGIRYEFHVIDSPSVNAFALPGGQIFVFTGLLETMKTESELAAVLGHEIGHVDARHCIERYQYHLKIRNLRLEPLSGLARLARALIAQGYAQHQELEADSIGVRLAINAGYDPRGAESMFRQLMKSQGSQVAAAPGTPLDELLRVVGTMTTDYFRSHPPTLERLRRVTGMIARESKRRAGKPVYVGAQNYQQRIPRTQQEFPGELLWM